MNEFGIKYDGALNELNPNAGAALNYLADDFSQPH